MAGTEGKSTPLILALVTDIEAIELKLYELAQEIPKSYPLKAIKRRLERLEKSEPPLLENGVPSTIVPLELEVGRIISNALLACGGDVEAAAIGLDVGTATIYRKIKKYGFDVEAIRKAARRQAEERHGDHGGDGESGP